MAENNRLKTSEQEDGMKGTGICMAALCMAAAVMGGEQAQEEQVTRRYEDVNADGIAEIVLENSLVRISLTTGEKEVNGVQAKERLNAKGMPVTTTFGNRFNWAGWIWDYTFKPSGREWFAENGEWEDNWHGIPECFEEAVRMKELSAGTYALMIPGIGTATGSGSCFRGSFRDVCHAPWTMTEEVLTGGSWKAAEATREPQGGDGWRVRFRQVIETEYGYGCDYEKTVTLLAGSSKLVVDRCLKNTGKESFGTIFFTHGFFRQGQDGGYDKDCWSIIPLRAPEAGGKAYPQTLLDTEPAHVLNILPGYYWGPVTREELGGSWHAAGNGWSGDVLMTALSKPVSFFRNWTYTKVYSCEPFLEIDLKSGESYAWEDVRAAGNGVRAVKAQGAGGLLDWELLRGRDGKWQLEFQVVPYQKGNGRLVITGELAGAGQTVPVKLEGKRTDYSPAAAVKLRMAVPEALVGAQAAVKLAVRLIGEDKHETPVLETDARFWLRAERRTAYHGKKVENALAVVFADIKRDSSTGMWTPNNQCRFWERSLREAGFKVNYASWNASELGVEWENMSLAIVATGRLSAGNVRHLEEFVKNGGGVIFQGPVDLRKYTDIGSDLLPITEVLGEVNVRYSSPRDHTREFVATQEKRYQLVETKASELTAGLPWYPQSYQGVGQFQLVTKKPEAEVVLSLVPGKALPQMAEPYPALLTSCYGAGKVALMTMPMMWGGPANHVWGRLGEYHTVFLAKLAKWANGESIKRAPACLATEKLENDSYDWYQRHWEKYLAARAKQYDIVMMGDSITHFWETTHGPQCWKELFKGRKVLNLGFGWDRTCNLLWRLDNGEWGKQHPKVFVLHIGTNNLSKTANYPGDTPEGVVEGIKAVVKRVQKLSPSTKIVVMKVFPRDAVGSFHRTAIEEVNRLLEAWVEAEKEITLLDIGPGMVNEDGSLDKSKYRPGDVCHLSEDGYKVWAAALEPVFREALKD